MNFPTMSPLRYASTLLTILLLAACSAVPHAHAGIIVSNLDQESNSGAGLTGSAYGPEGWLANRFTVGPGVWEINSLTLPLHTYYSGTTVNRFTFEIRNDVGTPGGTVVGAFDTALPLVTSMYSDRFTFDPSSTLSLPGGNYWLVMRPIDPESSDFWQKAQSGFEEVALSGWSIADTFSYSSSGNSGWYVDADNVPLTFSFDATQTAVPEPSSFALVALAAGGAWWKRRRAKHSDKMEPSS